MTTKRHAERAGTMPAGGLPAIPLYGPGGWREQNAQLFATDARLRTQVDLHRAELVECGALAHIGGRLVALQPEFDRAIVRIGRRMLGHRVEQRRAAVADAALRIVPQQPAPPARPEDDATVAALEREIEPGSRAAGAGIGTPA